MRLPTASQLDRVIACPGSHALPQYGSTSEHAARGTSIHAWIAANGARIANRTDFAEEMPFFAMLRRNLRDVLVVGAFYEQRFAWDPDRCQGEMVLNYDDTERFFGTADYIYEENGHTNIIDWKTGHRDLGRPRDSYQLRLAALAFGGNSVSISWGIIDDEGDIRLVTDRLDGFDQFDTTVRLNYLYDELRQPSNKIVTGTYCRYCPAFTGCPAKHRLIRAAIQYGTADIISPHPMGQAEVARAWADTNEVLDVFRRLRDELLEHADREPVDLGNGRRLGKTTQQWNTVDATAAYEYIARTIGEEQANTVCKRTTTLKALQDAGMDIAEMERDGIVKKVTKTTVREHKIRGDQ